MHPEAILTGVVSGCIPFVPLSMKPIIPPREGKAKQISAPEFYRQWDPGSMPYTGSPAIIYQKCMEFAEAYAAHRDEESAKLIEEDGDLLRRAAELLRQVGGYWAHNGPSGEQYDEFDKHRDQ